MAGQTDLSGAATCRNGDERGRTQERLTATTIRNLDVLFKSKSVALIGASRLPQTAPALSSS
jgi:hypothetical protein